jgi:hypothetical protein
VEGERMAKSEELVRVMDEAARRVLSGAQRPYDVALDTAGELGSLDRDSDSVSSWTAYALWIEISELFDMQGGPESEQLCDELAVEFSRGWLALVDRGDELVQRAFMMEFDELLQLRVSKYPDTW